MSFNYLEKSYSQIKELNESVCYINNSFQDFTSLDKYLYIIINQWNRDYPLPSLPNSILVLQINCNYDFHLNNLPSSIEILIISCKYPYPLDNLPLNLYQLEIYDVFCRITYEYSLNNLPESIKILKINNTKNQLSYNLPIGIKQLDFTIKTFADNQVIYPSELEILNISEYVQYESNNYLTIQEEDIRLETYYNLLNLPITLRILYLPSIKISNIDIILKRLIHLEKLYIPFNFNNEILEFPPNLKYLYLDYGYNYKVVNLPSTLNFLSIGNYTKSLEAIATSNIIHLETDDKFIPLIEYLPTSLIKLSIIETHHQLNEIKKLYPKLEINTMLDLDYWESQIDYCRE